MTVKECRNAPEAQCQMFMATVDFDDKYQREISMSEVTAKRQNLMSNVKINVTRQCQISILAVNFKYLHQFNMNA